MACELYKIVASVTPVSKLLLKATIHNNDKQLKFSNEISGLSGVGMMNAFPLRKVPNVEGVPNNWKWILNTSLTSYLKIGIIIRMSMVFQVLLGKVYHQKCQHNLYVFFQSLIELYQLLDLTLILTRKQVNIAICFVRHTKIVQKYFDVWHWNSFTCSKVVFLSVHLRKEKKNHNKNCDFFWGCLINMHLIFITV